MDQDGHINHTERNHVDDVDRNESSTDEGLGMYERYTLAISQIETEPLSSISTFVQIQEYIARQSYFSTSSTSSETLDDVSTSILPYMMIDHYLAMSYTQIPVDRYHISTRRINLLTACDYFNSFLQKLEAYDILTKEEKVQYQILVEMMDHINHNHDNSNNNYNYNNNNNDYSNNNNTTPSLLPPPMNRETKIAQYRQKQQLQQEQERLQSLQLRRKRLQATISDDEIMDGYDNESLIRTTNITAIHIAKMISYEEWNTILHELPMITMMMIQGQSDQHLPGGRPDDDRHHNNNNNDIRQPPKPMELTQITKDSMTGQLRIHRQEIQNKTFRPSWNQPTMSLDELAEREVHNAIQRQERQTQSELYQQTQPRRYEQLVKDGMEDNNDLVDASAILDRNWDVFKDENPRGSGNKRGDVGDRNF